VVIVVEATLWTTHIEQTWGIDDAQPRRAQRTDGCGLLVIGDALAQLLDRLPLLLVTLPSRCCPEVEKAAMPCSELASGGVKDQLNL